MIWAFESKLWMDDLRVIKKLAKPLPEATDKSLSELNDEFHECCICYTRVNKKQADKMLKTMNQIFALAKGQDRKHKGIHITAHVITHAAPHTARILLSQKTKEGLANAYSVLKNMERCIPQSWDHHTSIIKTGLGVANAAVKQDELVLAADTAERSLLKAEYVIKWDGAGQIPQAHDWADKAGYILLGIAEKIKTQWHDPDTAQKLYQGIQMATYPGTKANIEAYKRKKTVPAPPLSKRLATV